MKKKYLLTLMMVLASVVAAWAAPRSEQQAATIASRFASKVGWGQAPLKQVALNGLHKGEKAPATGEQKAYYYVFNQTDGKGFVLVAGDDRMPDIIGYSDRQTFELGNLPPQLADYLAAYRATVDAADRGDSRTLENLREAAMPAAITAIEPLLGDIAWNQNTPFNNHCPLMDNGYRCVTGCAPTALAQIMAYYQYPDTLVNTIPAYSFKMYSEQLETEVTMEAVEAGQPIEWKKMLPTYKGASYSEEEADAVASLMALLGKACQVMYGYESAAGTPISQLVDYFGYDPDLAALVSRSGFSLDEWRDIMMGELKAGRPMLLSGHSLGSNPASLSGHAFVCDGVDANGLFHINWGWGGYLNGYFDVTVLNPKGAGIGGSASDDGYDINLGMMIGITPDNHVTDEPIVYNAPQLTLEANQSVTLTKSSRTRIDDTFGLRANMKFSNYGPEFVGKVALGIRESDGSYKPVSKQYSVTIGHNQGFNEYNLEMDYALPVGKTALYLIENKGYGWTRTNAADHYPVTLEATVTQLRLADNHVEAIVESEGTLTAATKGQLNVTVKNNSLTTYLGRLYFYYNQTDACPDAFSDYLPVALEVGEELTRQMEVKPGKQGNFYVWVYDDRGALVGKSEAIPVDKAGVPIFTLESVSANSTSDRVITTLQDKYEVYLNKVYSDSVFFTYAVRNDGADGSLTLQFFNSCTTSGIVSGSSKFQLTHEVPSGETVLYRVPSAVLTPGSINVCMMYGSSQSLSYNKDIYAIDMADGKTRNIFQFNYNGVACPVFYTYRAGLLRDASRHASFAMLDDHQARLVKVDGEAEKWLTIDRLDHGMEGSNVNVTSVSVAPDAFKDCNKLTSLTLGSIVNTIDVGAFNGFNPNAVVYTEQSFDHLPATNVVLNGYCDSLVVSMGNHPWSPEYAFEARSAMADLSSVAQGEYLVQMLPFIDEEQKAKYLSVERIEGGQCCFKETLEPQPNVPYLLRWKQEEGSRVMKAHGVQISPSEGMVETGVDNAALAYCYHSFDKMSHDWFVDEMDEPVLAYYQLAADGSFGQMEVTAMPEDAMRGYLVTSAASEPSPQRLEIVDLADTGIDRMQADGSAEGLQVEMEEGRIVISATAARTVGIYAVDGRLVERVSLKPGVKTAVSLHEGVYLLGNRKVAICR